MTRDLITAQIRQRNIDYESLDRWLRRTHSNLLELWQRERNPPAEPAPSTPMHWRRSIRQKYIVCLECGQVFRQLMARHLAHHGLTVGQYRVKYDIPLNVPLAGRQTTRRRREVMQTIRPWEKRGQVLRKREAE